MKKTLLIILLIIVVLVVGEYLLNFNNDGKNQLFQNSETQNETGKVAIEDETSEEEINNEKMSEEEFNESGRAKAIEGETDLWQLYENFEVGVSLKYPSDIVLLEENEYNENPKQVYIKVETKDMGEKVTPLDFSKEDEMKNVEALTNGEFGLESNFVFVPSKNVKSVGFLYAQDFMVLSRFEVCDVTLERKLLFYFNNQQIIITLYASINELKETMPDYFVINEENCGEEKIWNFEKQDEFYAKLESGNCSAEIQKWFDDFDQISETVIFAHR